VILHGDIKGDTGLLGHTVYSIRKIFNFYETLLFFKNGLH